MSAARNIVVRILVVYSTIAGCSNILACGAFTRRSTAVWCLAVIGIWLLQYRTVRARIAPNCVSSMNYIDTDQ